MINQYIRHIMIDEFRKGKNVLQIQLEIHGADGTVFKQIAKNDMKGLEEIHYKQLFCVEFSHLKISIEILTFTLF